MTGRKSIDPVLLRSGAVLLTKEAGKPSVATFGAGDLGGAQADSAYDRFREYWSPGIDAIAHSIDAFAELLRAAADEYERRDADDSRGFAGGFHAF